MLRSLALPAAVGALALTACGNATTQQPVQAAAVPPASVSTLEAQELAALIATNKVVLIDVRTPEEFAEGRISGALNAPVQVFVPAMIPQESDRETILYCRSSGRSRVAAEELAAYLAKPVRHLEGGILTWEKAGLPVERAPD